MKRHHFLIVFMATILAACSKHENTPGESAGEMVTATAVLKTNGSFINGPYGRVSGTANLFISDGAYQLVLDNFTSSSGPDLKVYLSKEIMPVNFVNLGSLKSFAGKQVYNVPASVNAEAYVYVLIYCKQFSHLFGSAELK